MWLVTGATGHKSYILSAQKMSARYVLETVRRIIGHRFFKRKTLLDLAKFAAVFTAMSYSLARVTPRFTPYSLEVMRSNASTSHAKATYELGYEPLPLYASIREAVKWFVETK